jgi:hypothetical protein
LTRERPTLVVFLRHFGCTFCREALADVAHARPALAALETPLVFVHMVEPEEADPWLARAGFADAPRVSDPARAHYRAFGLKITGALDLLSPRTWARGSICALRHGFGAQPSDAVRQLPGVFVAHADRVLAAYRHRRPSDRPDYVELVRRGLTN